MNGPSVALIMPCLNEADALARLLPLVPDEVEVIVCDNGSTDGSPDLAVALGAKVVMHGRRRQLGRCIEKGIAASVSEIICISDCDGTIDPRSAMRLTRPISEGTADFVVGSRSHDVATRSASHRRASALRDAIVGFLIPEWPFPDLGTARAFRKSALGEQAERCDAHFGWNLDITLHAYTSFPQDRLDCIEIPYGLRVGRSKISGNSLSRLLAALDQLWVLCRFVTRRSFHPRRGGRATAQPSI